MPSIQKPEPAKEHKVTFMTKDSTKCQVCETEFNREELFFGRVNASDLTDELHRTYTPMQKYGEVHPLVYEMTVCPSCKLSLFRADFPTLTAKTIPALRESIDSRMEMATKLFPEADFRKPRGLLEGAASYLLGILCYEGLPKGFSPTIKQGICCLRCAWLCKELSAKDSGGNYGQLMEMLYSKARYLYKFSLELEQKGTELLTNVKWLGPDTDKNYGFEGILYLSALFEYKYGLKTDEAKRLDLLESNKRTLAKMFGLGKKTKSNPGPLVDRVRNLYDTLKQELNTEEDAETP